MKRLYCIALVLLLVGCPQTKITDDVPKSNTGNAPDVAIIASTSPDEIVPDVVAVIDTEVPSPVVEPTPSPAPVRVQRLDNDPEINDAKLEEICRDYPELVELTLQGTSITDAGLVHLLKLTKLRKIRLAKTAITDAGMRDLAKCEFLEDVDISQTKIGDFGVWELRALPRLKRLNLYLTLATDAGLDSFRRGDHRSAAKIEWLNLDKCPITDEGLPKLASLTSLAWLHLGGTAVTDAGLVEVAKFESLKDVIVTKTETTLEGIEKLRQARPDMNIRDNVSANTPQEEIDEAAELRKQLAPIREKGRSGFEGALGSPDGQEPIQL
jgi:hypothetical protein